MLVLSTPFYDRKLCPANGKLYADYFGLAVATIVGKFFYDRVATVRYRAAIRPISHTRDERGGELSGNQGLKLRRHVWVELFENVIFSACAFLVVGSRVDQTQIEMGAGEFGS